MSFSASLSGLNANQQKLKVIGNNLANLNTVAFKASTVDFSDLVSQSVGGASANPAQIGLGVTTGSISPNFKQGGIENTGVPTHVSVQGSGFFVVGDPAGQAYTRAGNFSFDADGTLVTPEGKPVLGYTATDANGNIVTIGQPGNIVVPPGVLRNPVATTSFSTVSNLNAGAPIAGTFTSTVTIFDSLGAAHAATITYTKTAPGAWNYAITVPGVDITAGVPGTPFQIAAGNLTFDANGELATVNGVAAADVTIAGPAWSNGATATGLTWDLIDANANGLLKGFAQSSETSSITQNGDPAGTIDSITINSAGQLVGTLGAGNAIVVAQLAMASFNNPQGLVKLGSNLFGASVAAGLPSVGIAGTGGRGGLIGGSLEQSNVDIATEFTQMILAQRGYQACSKGITVADELLVETLSLKR
jgi:flagellar hook protein FlgE